MLARGYKGGVELQICFARSRSSGKDKSKGLEPSQKPSATESDVRCPKCNCSRWEAACRSRGKAQGIHDVGIPPQNFVQECENIVRLVLRAYVTQVVA